MPTTPSSQDVTLRTLRAIIDAGGPQRPVTSGPRVTATIGRPSGLERPLPMGDEFLARVRTIGDLLNELGLSPLENAVGWILDRFHDNVGLTWAWSIVATTGVSALTAAAPCCSRQTR